MELNIAFPIQVLLVACIGIGILVGMGALAGVLLGRNPLYSPDGKSIGLSRGLKRVLILVAEVMAFIQVVIFTLVGAALGVLGASMMAQFRGYSPGLDQVPTQVIGLVTGGLFGFLGTVAWAALIFLIAEAERSTRVTAVMLQRMMLSAQARSTQGRNEPRL